jgi:hypothetical protein
MKPKDKFSELKIAANKYSLTLKAHLENPKDADALAEWDTATNEFSALINSDEENIIFYLLEELEAAQKESVYFCNLNAQKNERIGELEAAQNEISAKTLDHIADKMSKAMNELRVFDRMLYANNIQVMRNVASIIRREAERMRDSKVPGDSVNTQDVNIGWLQRATPGAPE